MDKRRTLWYNDSRVALEHRRIAVVKELCVTTIKIITVAALLAAFLISRGYGLAESTGPGGSRAKAVHDLGETGEGVAVGLISGGNVRTTHKAFYDKDPNGEPTGSSMVLNHDFSGDGISIVNHDTWVAGVVASRGDANHPDDIGVAPGVQIHSARVGDDQEIVLQTFLENALYELTIVENCRVIVTTVQLSVNANGQSQETLLYDYYAWTHNVVFANAAGNNGSQVTAVGDAYNAITTGGLILSDSNDELPYCRAGAQSGSGPTADGRRKPDVTAPSQAQTVPTATSDTSWTTWSSAGGATSFAAPHTAGVAALLLALADDTAQPDDDRNEVIRAVIVNSTFPNIDDKTGRSTNPAVPENTWHPDRGYGRIDALRAYELLASGKVAGGTQITRRKGWAYSTINMYGNHSYFIAGGKGDRLVATVTWNRQINKMGRRYSQETAPKFDLAVTVKDSDGGIIFSNTDKLNNLKKIEVVLEADGVYEIELVNTSSKRGRSYALAFELIERVRGDFWPIDYIVDHRDLNVLAQQWLLEADELEADLFSDGTVNLPDFSELGAQWLQRDPAYWHE